MIRESLGLLTASLLVVAAAKDIDVRSFGAKGDGAADDTLAIQGAIDACSAAGGGRVILKDGTFWTRPILLKSGVDFHLDRTATLFASGDWHDYPGRGDLVSVVSERMPRGRDAALITADGAHHIAITGDGVINGNSEPFVRLKPREKWRHWRYERIGFNSQSPPRVVMLSCCSDVLIRDVTVTNQPSCWAYMIHGCTRVNVERTKVLSNVYYPNNDGIHINSSSDVTVSDCTVVAGDDALVIRASNSSFRDGRLRATERVNVVNCHLRGYSNGIRVAWCRDGTIRDCAVSNCTIADSTRGISIWLYEGDPLGDCGIEKTLVENIVFGNLVMDRIHTYPISVVVGEPGASHCDAVRNITFANLVCRGYAMPEFVGAKDRPLQNFLFNGCRFVRTDAADVRPPWLDEPEPWTRGKSATTIGRGYLWGNGGEHANDSNPFHNCRGFVFNGCTFDNE